VLAGGAAAKRVSQACESVCFKRVSLCESGVGKKTVLPDRSLETVGRESRARRGQARRISTEARPQMGGREEKERALLGIFHNGGSRASRARTPQERGLRSGVRPNRSGEARHCARLAVAPRVESAAQLRMVLGHC
jgi:hypothetical protein